MRPGELNFVRIGAHLLYQLRQSKIEDLDPPVFGDEDIFGFQVAVDDPFLVRRRQPMRDLHPILDRFALRQGAAVQGRAQALALQKLGDQERRVVMLPFFLLTLAKLTLVVSTDVKYREDIGMIERGYSPRLLLEATQAVAVAGERVGKNF